MFVVFKVDEKLVCFVEESVFEVMDMKIVKGLIVIGDLFMNDFVCVEFVCFKFSDLYVVEMEVVVVV